MVSGAVLVGGAGGRSGTQFQWGMCSAQSDCQAEGEGSGRAGELRVCMITGLIIW